MVGVNQATRRIFRKQVPNLLFLAHSCLGAEVSWAERPSVSYTNVKMGQFHIMQINFTQPTQQIKQNEVITRGCEKTGGIYAWMKRCESHWLYTRDNVHHMKMFRTNAKPSGCVPVTRRAWTRWWTIKVEGEERGIALMKWWWNLQPIHLSPQTHCLPLSLTRNWACRFASECTCTWRHSNMLKGCSSRLGSLMMLQFRSRLQCRSCWCASCPCLVRGRLSNGGCVSAWAITM